MPRIGEMMRSATVGRAQRRRNAVASAPWPAAQRGLTAIERAFEFAFTPAANPWRHLGALGFFLFWIVAASGIYLYVFFDTSVAGAYASVEALAREQRYLGGVMRSLHRYASDAFVMVVLLHLAREFVHGRFSGFRWFSWLTGVPLLWLVCASGIGGYWLVWDALAQFIAAATTEWFDWLGIFGEPLARNFLHAGSVNDRFFTLLVFLHIGIPLLLLLGMFVHVQRVTEPETQPAGGLAGGTLAGLVVLALLAPAQSRPPADLAGVPQQLGVDWFYLLAYPLISNGSAGAVWALAVTATLLVAVLPWLRRTPAQAVAEVDPGHCNGCGRCFDDCPYAAVVMVRAGGGPSRRPQVDPALCASCGICAGACPSSTPFRGNRRLVTGIDMPQYPVDALRAELEMRLAGLAGECRMIVFGCDCAAEAAHCEAPDVATFSLLCIGQLPPSFVEYALRNGADGILVTGCRDGECRYRSGNAFAAARLAREREPHLRRNVARERVRTAWFGAGEEAALARSLARFREELKTQLRGTSGGSRRRRLYRAE